MTNFVTLHRNKLIVAFVLFAALVVFLVTRNDALVITSRVIDLHSVTTMREGSYAAFLHNHRHTAKGADRIDVEIFNPSGYGYYIMEGFEGADRVLRMEERSFVEFTVNMPADGMYNLQLVYFPVAARGIDISRELRINGEVPFSGADLVEFRRIWGSSGIGVRTDNRGNQIRPPQVELPRWERAFFSDRLGYTTDPYQFFFKAGLNTISLTGVSEPLAISGLALMPVVTAPSFDQFMRTTDLNIMQNNFMLRVQGEDSTVRSSPSLFPLFDNSSGITDPPSASLITLNMIGGQPWRVPGQWIEWEFDVPQAGLYRISVSARQNYNRGFVSSRSLYVNGEMPFAEVAAIPFRFNNSWELLTLSDDDGNDLFFPLNEGTNTIRMYVTLGDLGEIVESMLASVNRLNAIYREILVLTGPSPDSLRDYRIHHELPHVMVMIDEEIDILYKILRQLEAYTGERNEQSAIMATLVRQMDLFYRRPDRIPLQLGNFRQNISAAGDAARLLTEGQLDIDFFIISGADAQLPRVRETFFTRASHEIRSFANSFIMDFDNLGDIHEGDKVIEVWITTGRDQATVLKSMIDDTFVPNFGIGVNLRLVAHSAVLPAIVAGIGPDVVLSLPNQDPANFAFRNAAMDLSVMPAFWDVYGRFAESAMVPFEFRDGFYALPETQTFNVMYYRKDILGDLGLDIPRTWTDLIAMMPVLQRNNLSIGITPIGDPMNPQIGQFITQLYQRGGFLYNDDHSRTILDNEEAIAAFEMFTQFYTHYGAPRIYNFENRFRSGEMPIGFADFTASNMLSVFAPEIAGLWDFALIPGYMNPDGTVNHTVPTWGTAAVINAATDLPLEGWEFLKWWTDAETQLRFGRELESIMGAAARYPTANLEAFRSLTWSSAQLAILEEQRSWTLGTPEIPGGYYVTRHLVNAIRRVVNDDLDTRETLLDFVIVINRELMNKRIEFGLE